ncbi:MAG: hypothetical protein WED09_07135 [Homoserinimonas sp.]
MREIMQLRLGRKSRLHDNAPGAVSACGHDVLRLERGDFVAIPDGYDLGARISDGAEAQVWTSQNASGQTVVLKIAADEPRVQKRFERELFAMVAAANRHVMPILDFDSSHSWYTMPYASHALSEAAVPSSVSECVEILQAVAGELKPLHADDQVHRDLKPDNILWLDGEDGARWVVADEALKLQDT